MNIDIVNADVVTGDGTSYLEGASVFTEGGLITDVPRQSYPAYRYYAHRIIDAESGIVMPGLINTHVHNIAYGPTGVFGWTPLPDERVIANLDRHLLQGTTTALDLDGFVLPFENEAINKIHPVNVKRATQHTPKNVRAAELESRERIEEVHRSFTAEESVALGAVAMGEIGAPATSSGTWEKNKRLGTTISVQQAAALDEAYARGDDAAFVAAMKNAGIEDLGVEKARQLVFETSVECIEAANEAIIETIDYAPRLGVPALCHTEPTSYDALREASKKLGPLLMAEHVNHNCTVEQAVELATAMRKQGSFVEIFTADSLSAKQLEPDEGLGHALLSRGLVDSICTDYSGGYHDPLLKYFKNAVEKKVITLPQIVRLSTSSPAKVVPGLASNKGLIEPGRVADLIIVDRNDISNVQYVIIAGRIVVERGRIVA